MLEEVAADQFATPTAYLAHYGITDLIEVRDNILVSDSQALKRLHEGERTEKFMNNCTKDSHVDTLSLNKVSGNWH